MHRLIFFFCLLTFGLSAQTNEGLQTYLSFDDCDTGVDGIAEGNPGCECGVLGNSLRLDGKDDHVRFRGEINNLIGSPDFTISFYIKPTSFTGVHNIISKSTACVPTEEDKVFVIRYNTNNRSVSALLNDGKNIAQVEAKISPDVCWQHVALVRDDTELLLFINGILAAQGRSSLRVKFDNSTPLNIANGKCVNLTDVRYEGLLDELRIYDRALSKQEVRELYIKPDDILTLDTLLVLGDAVSTKISNSCAGNFAWSPVEGVANPLDPETTITPPISGVSTYYLSFDDNQCIARDSLVIRVVDPGDLDCTQIFLPNAFTPNDDNTNDTYGISNPFVIEELVSFEIYDRLGNRLFFTEDKTARWDGNFQGQQVNPGVFLYRVLYRCRGEELKETGVVTILR
ncbi:MAG: LamG-like jellyroll fold domain-containing protein [Bacteroidota bacterium]